MTLSLLRTRQIRTVFTRVKLVNIRNKDQASEYNFESVENRFAFNMTLSVSSCFTDPPVRVDPAFLKHFLNRFYFLIYHNSCYLLGLHLVSNIIFCFDQHHAIPLLRTFNVMHYCVTNVRYVFTCYCTSQTCLAMMIVSTSPAEVMTSHPAPLIIMAAAAAL